MKSSRSLALCLLLSFFGASSAVADRGGYVIRSFDVALEVEPGSDLLVEERLVVEFFEARHGIYRTIPIRYTDPRGYIYSLDLRVIGVVDELGNSHTTEISREGRYAKIRIGDPDRTVQGLVSYYVRYRVRDAVQHFAEHDELYWNATGNEWQADIESASATVRLPGPLEPGSLEAAAYTGVFGSRAQAARVDHPEPGVVTYRASNPLGPLEGLTIVAAWPHGLVSFPGRFVRAWRLFADNWIIVAPALAFGFLWFSYWATGRDPEGPASVMVRYEPPPDLTAGEIGALVDERVDLRDITATVVDLAVRGYLRIRIDEEKHLFGLFSTEQTAFERIPLEGRPDGDLRPFEREVLDGIFASGDVVSTKDLEEKFYRRIPGIRDAVWEDLYRRRYVAGKPDTVRRTWKLLSVVAAAATFGVGYLWASFQGALFPHALVVPILSAGLVALLFLVFSPAMPRRTRKGVESRAWALGFEEFVDRVEREKLEADQQRNVFEALLPYAMALGVAAAWARRFEGIYQTASPSWFVGPRPMSGFSTTSFESSLSSAMSRAGSGMTSAPRSSGSSGSGGGGFSGGGGGGGGGGSW